MSCGCFFRCGRVVGVSALLVETGLGMGWWKKSLKGQVVGDDHVGIRFVRNSSESEYVK